MFLCFQEILCPDGKRCCPEGHLCSTDGRSCIKTGEILFYRQPVYIYLKKQSQKLCPTISPAARAAGELQQEPGSVR